MKALTAIVNMILSLFKRPTLTHPQEHINYITHFNENTVPDTIYHWFIDWQVPSQYWGYWRSIPVKLDPNLPYPAWVLNGELSVRPEWLSPGVLAHEFAHVSYSHLSENEKAEFEQAYTPLIKTDHQIKYLYSVNTYGLSSDVEGHAEIYRYTNTPEVLRKFYPKLF